MAIFASLSQNIIIIRFLFTVVVVDILHKTAVKGSNSTNSPSSTFAMKDSISTHHHLRPLIGVTPTERALGGFSLGTFVLIWLLSVSSPILFLYGVFFDMASLAIFVAIFTVLAYIPWYQSVSHLLVRKVQGFFRYYTPRYYPSCQIVYDGKATQQDMRQTFYAIHPHGAFCMGWGILFIHEAFESVRFCFAPYLFMSPFFRIFCRLTGRPGSAAKFDMVSYMKQGESLALPPGGFEEATLTSLHQDRVFIRKRTGFIRLCLKCGVAVQPVFVFGEKDCYWNIQGGWKLRLALNRIGIPTIISWGCSWLPLLPKTNASLYIAIGEPMILPTIDDPSKEQVKIWHEKYIAALTKLYETHKEEAYGSEIAKTMKLEVW